MGQTKTAETKAAARSAENSTAVQLLARLGLAARGIVWLVIGLLAVQVALGSNAKADKNGALRAIADQPFGRVLLVVLIVGFLGYATWRLLAAAVGHLDEEPGRRRWTARGLSLFRGLVYLGLGASTAKFLVSGGGGDKTQPLTARVMAAGGGRVLVLAVGAGVVIVGIVMAVAAFGQRFEDELDMSAMPAPLRSATTVIGTAGLASRAFVVGLVGSFLFLAALHFRPQQAKGLDASLRTLAAQPFGRALLLVAAVGLLAFAVESAIEARYRKI